MTIREYMDKDYNLATDLMRKLTELMGEKFDEFRWKTSLLARKHAQEAMFVAIEAERVVGMSFAEIRGPKGRTYGYISTVIVDEDYRGQGVGELLIQKAIMHLGRLGVDIVQINVRKEAAGAIRLYEKIGFKEKFRVMELELHKAKKKEAEKPPSA
ncbi:MAG TPA: GNAT family N-acetyltransferase [Candidatus Deferrimicrobium sp.]|nr:GNAT family N-acetyltransferase [Candidatus Deferrimicrobium sp.]